MMGGLGQFFVVLVHYLQLICSAGMYFAGRCPTLNFWGFATSVRTASVQILRSRILMLLIILPVVRIGEASNPGPDDSTFILGIANPSGLRNKAPFVASQMAYGDLWAFSETHLCSKGLPLLRCLEAFLFRFLKTIQVPGREWVFWPALQFDMSLGIGLMRFPNLQGS